MNRLVWDSGHFGVAIARADPGAALDGELAVARAEGIDCLYASAPAAEVQRIAGLVRAGGRLVDLRVELERAGESEGDEGVRRATDADAEHVERAAASLAPYSRFSRDGRFAAERVAEMYRLWASRLLAEGVVVVPEGGKGGMVAVSTGDGEVRLDLVYVDPGASGHGLGAALVRGALAAAGASRARVATQAGNVAALRLYESLGFRAFTSEAIVHLWLDEVA